MAGLDPMVLLKETDPVAALVYQAVAQRINILREKEEKGRSILRANAISRLFRR